MIKFSKALKKSDYREQCSIEKTFRYCMYVFFVLLSSEDTEKQNQ